MQQGSISPGAGIGVNAGISSEPRVSVEQGRPQQSMVAEGAAIGSTAGEVLSHGTLRPPPGLEGERPSKVSAGMLLQNLEDSH